MTVTATAGGVYVSSRPKIWRRWTSCSRGRRRKYRDFGFALWWWIGLGRGMEQSGLVEKVGDYFRTVTHVGRIAFNFLPACCFMALTGWWATWLLLPFYSRGLWGAEGYGVNPIWFVCRYLCEKLRSTQCPSPPTRRHSFASGCIRISEDD